MAADQDVAEDRRSERGEDQEVAQNPERLPARAREVLDAADPGALLRASRSIRELEPGKEDKAQRSSPPPRARRRSSCCDPGSKSPSRREPISIGCRHEPLGTHAAAADDVARRPGRSGQAGRSRGLHGPLVGRDRRAGRFHPARLRRGAYRQRPRGHRRRRRLSARPRAPRPASGCDGGGHRRALRARHRRLVRSHRRGLERHPLRKALLEGRRDRRVPRRRAHGRAHAERLQARDRSPSTRSP